MLFQIDNRFFTFVSSFFEWNTNAHFGNMLLSGIVHGNPNANPNQSDHRRKLTQFSVHIQCNH